MPKGGRSDCVKALNGVVSSRVGQCVRQSSSLPLKTISFKRNVYLAAASPEFCGEFDFLVIERIRVRSRKGEQHLCRFRCDAYLNIGGPYGSLSFCRKETGIDEGPLQFVGIASQRRFHRAGEDNQVTGVGRSGCRAAVFETRQRLLDRQRGLPASDDNRC